MTIAMVRQQWMPRAVLALLRGTAAAAPCSGEGALAQAPFALVRSSASCGPLDGQNSAAAECMGPLPPLGFARGFRGSALDTGLELPSRKHLFTDLPLAAALLPHREHMAAQFTPHGIMIVPKAILEAEADGAAQHEQQVARSTAAPTAPVEESEEELEPELQAIGVKTWRRLKMKKHKIRKRRRAERMKVK